MGLRKILRYIDLTSEVSGKAIGWFALLVTLVLVYEVASRYLFGSPTVWAFDISYMLGGTLFMIGAAWTYQTGGHVRVDIFYERYPRRVRAAIDVLMMLLLFFPVWVILFGYSIPYVQNSWAIQERSLESFWRPPIYPFKTVIPIALLLFLLQGLAQFVRSLVLAVWGKEL
jgi:TRAP-type mannitol/chloroaromatic compound transport system permease small subunit